MATPGTLATVNLDTVIERIANGAITQHIARELNVHHSSLYRQLAKHPEYALAKESGFEARLDQAEEDIRSADECTLPRAREVWRAVTWRAERECPSRWGQRTQVDVNIDISQALSELSQRLAAQQPPQRTIEHNEVSDAQVIDDKRE